MVHYNSGPVLIVPRMIIHHAFCLHTSKVVSGSHCFCGLPLFTRAWSARQTSIFSIGQPEGDGRVRYSAWLSVAAKPVRETRRTETWIVPGREALVVH